MGTFAIQLAKHFGAEVTGVDSGGKLDKLRSLGADHVLDYTREDYTESDQRYDLIIDCVANRSVSDYTRVLSPNGVFLAVGGPVLGILRIALKGTQVSRS